MRNANTGGGKQNLTRRRFVLGAGGVLVAGVAAGCAAAGTSGPRRGTARRIPVGAVGSQPAGLPVRQYAWDATLARDEFGNAVPPRFNRLLLFNVRGTPTRAYRDLLEASLRKLERTHRWGPDGLLFTAAWGHEYFTEVLRTAPPIPRATAMSSFEQPVIESFHLCLHLACDDQQRLVTAGNQLITELAPILAWKSTKTGFVGSGIPHANQNVGGIPVGHPVPADAPLYMGFKSALKKNIATEDAVTITDGPFAQGTTMHLSYMNLTLEGWYGNHSEAERVALMYSPQTTVAASKRFTTDAESNPGLLKQAITRYSMIGHSQSCATARVNNKPIILRRDFDTTDGNLAGLHFISLQHSIEDFVKTRVAMNQANASLENPAITETVNNGINNFIFVKQRENFIIPSRAQRSFPLLRA